MHYTDVDFATIQRSWNYLTSAIKYNYNHQINQDLNLSQNSNVNPMQSMSVNESALNPFKTLTDQTCNSDNRLSNEVMQKEEPSYNVQGYEEYKEKTETKELFNKYL